MSTRDLTTSDASEKEKHQEGHVSNSFHLERISTLSIREESATGELHFYTYFYEVLLEHRRVTKSARKKDNANVAGVTLKP